MIDILLCEKAPTASQGDACGQDGKVLKLYEESPMGDYESYIAEDAYGDTENLIDFLNPTDRLKLSKDITYSDSHVGDYEAVVVHFYRAFKMKGSVTLNNNQTYYTKDSSVFEDNGKSSLDHQSRTVLTNTNTGPAEDTVFFLPNGWKNI